jgi:hypothetical protein
MLKIKIILLSLLLSTGFINGQMLTVQQTIQEQDQWCWDASSCCVLNYYGQNIAQCTIAEYTRTVATWYNFGSTNCCVNASLGCNYWNYNWGTAGSIQDILQHWGVNNFGVGSAFSLTTVHNELAAGRPFIFRWGWTTGGGHFLVGHGISMSDSMMSYMNPWPGEGLEIAKYSWIVSSSDHSWTHTNQITTNPLPVGLTTFTYTTVNNSVKFDWETATEVNNSRFELQRMDQNDAWIQVGTVNGSGNSSSPKYYSFLDNESLPNGIYKFRLKQVDLDGRFIYSKELEVKLDFIPLDYSLLQNYPNPFNPVTTINYTLPAAGNVKLQIYSVAGQIVNTLIDKHQDAGYYSVDFSAYNLSSGIYIYRLSVDNKNIVRKMMLLK